MSPAGTDTVWCPFKKFTVVSSNLFCVRRKNLLQGVSLTEDAVSPKGSVGNAAFVIAGEGPNKVPRSERTWSHQLRRFPSRDQSYQKWR